MKRQSLSSVPSSSTPRQASARKSLPSSLPKRPQSQTLKPASVTKPKLEQKHLRSSSSPSALPIRSRSRSSISSLDRPVAPKSPASPTATNLSVSQLATLKQWFTSHIRDPHPTENDKVELSALTGLTTQQVNNWIVGTRSKIDSAVSKRRNSNASSISNSSSRLRPSGLSISVSAAEKPELDPLMFKKIHQVAKKIKVYVSEYRFVLCACNHAAFCIL